MSRDLKADLCIIGAGAAGLSVAAGAAQLGLSVVLFEAGEMGGDCLNYGCVPSKALIAAGAQAQSMRDSARFGIAPNEPQIDWAAVKTHVKSVIAAIEPNDSQARFEGFGVKVIRDRARFEDARTVVSASARVRARRFVIATGSRPMIPNIPGLDTAPYYTNETIFDLDQLPAHLVILGGGAIGLELGQAFRRLGARVTIVDAVKLLANADSDAATLVLARLLKEGVSLLESTKVLSAAKTSSGVSLTMQDQTGKQGEVNGSHLLIATGRTPALDGLNLEAASVEYTRAGVTTSPTLRSTTNSRVWALGDAAGRGLFTHTAGWHASAFVRNVMFKARTAADALAMPSVMFTDPELAQLGLTEAQARARYGNKITVTRWDLHDNDRAQTAGDTEGFCKLVIGKGGAILGATIVGADAGELLAPISLSMANKLGVRALTAPVLAYPTRGEIVKRAASAYFTPTLFSAPTRFVVKLLQAIP